MFVQIKNDNWLIDKLIVGELMVNCYIVVWKPTTEAVIVDPGGEPEIILDRIAKLGVKVTSLVNTHGHGDHIGGNTELVQALNVPLLIGKHDAPMLTDARLNLSAPFGMNITSCAANSLLSEGDIVEVGDGRLKVVETPGHSPGSITLIGDGFALVGDLLFAGSVGRTDFPGGSFEQLVQMIRDKIFPLGDDCVVLPGHESVTTIGEERRSNPFLKAGIRLGW